MPNAPEKKLVDLELKQQISQGKNAKYNSCIFHQDVVKAM